MRSIVIFLLLLTGLGAQAQFNESALSIWQSGDKVYVGDAQGNNVQPYDYQTVRVRESAPYVQIDVGRQLSRFVLPVNFLNQALNPYASSSVSAAVAAYQAQTSVPVSGTATGVSAQDMNSAIATATATKAPLNSPVFSGTATAQNLNVTGSATVGNQTTSANNQAVANTKFVQDLLKQYFRDSLTTYGIPFDTAQFYLSNGVIKIKPGLLSGAGSSTTAPSSASLLTWNFDVNPPSSISAAQGIYQGSGPDWDSGGNTGVALKRLNLGNDGYVEMQIVATDGELALIGLNSTGGNGQRKSNLKAGMFAFQGTVRYWSGTAEVNTGVSYSVGDWLRLSIVGPTIKLQKSSNRSTYTDVYTFTYTRTSDLYIGMALHVNAKAYSVSGYNLTTY